MERKDYSGDVSHEPTMAIAMATALVLFALFLWLALVAIPWVFR